MGCKFANTLFFGYLKLLRSSLYANTIISQLPHKQEYAYRKVNTQKQDLYFFLSHYTTYKATLMPFFTIQF